MDNDFLSIETRVSLEDNALELGVRKLGAPSFHTCPDCGGSMVGIVEGPITRFRCHTGHAFTQRALAHQRASEIEKTLWSALAQLGEFQTLLGEIDGWRHVGRSYGS